MLREIKGMHGAVLLARDGEIGKVEEVLFDDHLWTVRYIVVDTGGWLTGRKVLIPPIALGVLEWSLHLLNVNLTRGQVERSPAAETAKPVSRQWESDYYDYYVWPYYWAGMGATGIPWYSGAMLPDAGEDMPEPTPEQGDPHLRSTNEVRGYKIEAQDGPLGHIADFIVDDETWIIRYLAADTGDWWPGKKVLLPTEWIGQTLWPEQTVTVEATRDQVQSSPEWHPHEPISPAFEMALSEYISQQRLQTPSLPQITPDSKPPQEWTADERTIEPRSDEDNARAEADAQRAEQVQDQEGPRIGDLGSLEE